MNRPLFFAVLCFALGEVTYIFANKSDAIGAIFVAPICVVLVLLKLKLSIKRVILYVVMLSIGISRIWWSEYNDVSKILFGEEKETVTLNYSDFCVSFLGTDSECKDEIWVMGVGVVDNISIGSSGYNVTINVKESKTKELIIYKNYKIIVYGVEECEIGETVEFVGILNDFDISGNPGEFNRKNYYKARGIVGSANSENITLDKGLVSIELSGFEQIWYSLKAGLCQLRETLKERLYEICDSDSGDVLSGILLGDKNNIEEGLMMLYRLSGIAHIFAISGVCTLSLVSLRPP